MKTWVKKISVGMALLAAVTLSSFGLLTPAHAANGSDGQCSIDSSGDQQNGSIQNGINCAAPKNASQPLFGENDSLFQRVTGILIFLIGVISVIMLIIGGIRYAVSGGDQSAVTAAKNTILYAVIGLVVAFLAFGISSFVINFLANDSNS